MAHDVASVGLIMLEPLHWPATLPRLRHVVYVVYCGPSPLPLPGRSPGQNTVLHWLVTLPRLHCVSYAVYCGPSLLPLPDPSPVLLPSICGLGSACGFRGIQEPCARIEILSPPNHDSCGKASGCSQTAPRPASTDLRRAVHGGANFSAPSAGATGGRPVCAQPEDVWRTGGAPRRLSVASSPAGLAPPPPPSLSPRAVGPRRELVTRLRGAGPSI